METKRPSWTLFDTLPNPNTADRSHQSGRQISREPSPRPGATTQMERERERNREEEWRREREMERATKTKTRNRGKDVEPRERYPERDRPPAPRGREGEREWRDRERLREAERRPNGRPTSTLETVTVRAMERGKKKGDTFPRMRKDSKERDRGMHTFTEIDVERGAKRTMGRQKRTEIDDRERERERARRREKQGDEEKRREWEREAVRNRAREDRERGGGRAVGDKGTGRPRERPREPDPGVRERRRERDSEGNDLSGRRERDTGRERERPRPGSGEREARMPSPWTRRDRENYPDRESREKAERRDRKRDTRSEGDSDDERRRERVYDREREELKFRHCRSEGDNEGTVERKKDRERQRCMEEERQRDKERDRERKADRARTRDEGRERGAERDVDRYREMARRKERGFEREGERLRDEAREVRGIRQDDRQWPSDRREGDRFRERKEEEEVRRRRDRRDRETESRLEETAAAGGRGRPPPSEVAPRPPPRAQSSSEFSSDMDGGRRWQRARDSYEERESGRESTADSERDAEDERERGLREPKRSGRADREREEARMAARAEQKRMWLEPQMGTYKKDSSLEDEVIERERCTRKKERKGGGEERGSEGQREKEEQEVEESHLDQGKSRGRHYESERREGYTEREERRERESETEGVSVDAEEASEAWGARDRGGEERLPGGDGEDVTKNTEESDREEEGGNNSYSRSESEGGSEKGWERERDRMLSGEDGFVTGSSGGEGEDERDEEDFEDCKEFWDGGVTREASRCVGFQGHEGEGDREEEWTGGKEDRVEEEGEEGDEGQGAGKRPKYVFCVIGQTLPRSKPSQKSELDPMERQMTNNPNTGSSQHGSDDIKHPAQNDLQPFPGRDDEYTTNDNQETKQKGDECNMPMDKRSHTDETSGVDVGRRISSEEMTRDGERSKLEHPYAEIGPIKRDSVTEKLLTEWRERNKQAEREREQFPPSPINPYGQVGSQGNSAPIQASPDGNNPRTMTPEEEVAIRIRMSGAWSMAEEAKRHSQAPHLKWAQTVMREILGSSEEHGIDDPQVVSQGGQEVNPPERGTTREEEEEDEMTAGSGDMPVYATVQKSRGHDRNSGAEVDEVEEVEPLEMEDLRGTGQRHGYTPTDTHTDTPVDTGRAEAHGPPKITTNDPTVHPQVDRGSKDEGDRGDDVREKAGSEIQTTAVEEEARREREVEMYLSVSNTLYRPNSCPSLIYDLVSDLPIPAVEVEAGRGEEEERAGGSEEEERQGAEHEERGPEEEVKQGSQGQGTEEERSRNEGEVAEKRAVGLVKSSFSFRDLGPEARIRRRGIRKTTERRKEEHVEEEEEEGVGRDRRTRIFTTPDDEDGKSESWGEVDLRNVLDTIGRRKRNSKFFNAAQLYQQYSEAAQNIEILRQARSDVLSTCEDQSGHFIAPLPSSSPSSSPAPSPPPARRPLPPLPPVPHPHSLSHSGSISSGTSSVKNLPLPEPPRPGGRPSSPRLSISLGQSATLWQDLPGVRNSAQLEDLTEDQRRLQEVRFEVVTSEASYCRSLDIVVEHFVKSKQLGALLTTQDRNWLFSRLADVRAISHSFLSKLEERVESDTISFSVCDIIARHCQRFKMVYVPYLTNQSYQDATYQRLMDENQGFKRVVDKLERSPVCQRLPLRSFLILPFQRITRIKLLVQNIVKRTAPGTDEVAQAIKALKLLEKLIQESNDSISQMKSIESLVSLSAKVDFECRTLPLISQSRRLVREGPVTELMDFSLKDTERSVYLHLFNDYLLLSLHKEGGRFTVIDHAPVSDLRAENCRVKLHSLQKNLFRLHLSGKALLLRTDTQSDKLRWISAVSRPHPPIDFSAAQDFTQMQCIRAFVAQQPDELSLEKADIILVHQKSSDGWVEGTKLSDRHRGWMPESHLETITNSRVRQRNLSDALKLTTATAAM